MTDVWPTVHAERAALIADLENLTPDQWATPSLCTGWDVHDVVAHLIATAKTTRWNFAKHLIAARFDFDRANMLEVADERRDNPADTLAAFRAVQFRTSTPPAPKDTRLVEAFVHGEDIRRPLGIMRAYPADDVVPALRLQARTGASLGGGKERVAGLSLRATDADFAIGTGALVEGEAISLLLAVSGRTVAPSGLDGPGAPLLAARA